ncbi:SsgA family sporulation/cell division regulator [Streptosporangium sp. OZ121]|uniref:SsgA family sporulation/cell division regulator n=1 Tax=Streptosporangium sp. OZ121 TaxID=3444183 RepID=UPI003F793212
MSPADAINERSLFIQMWDYGTNEAVDAWLIYRPADPHFVRIPMTGSAAALDVPRAVLQQGTEREAVCADLLAFPSMDEEWVLWSVQVGGLRGRTFRVSRDLLGRHLAAMYELVPLGAENDRNDWDNALKVLLQSP